METSATDSSIKHSVVVDATQERAFYAFPQQMNSWWPRHYTWSGENFGHIVLEPEQGSRWYEVDSTGHEKPSWGMLRMWEPPARIGLTWMIGAKREPEADPTHASDIELTFSEEVPDKTKVEVHHTGFERHGDAWEGYREGMAGAEGWPKILQSFADYMTQQINFGSVAQTR